MKKISVIFAALCVVFGVCGCSAENAGGESSSVRTDVQIGYSAASLESSVTAVSSENPPVSSVTSAVSSVSEISEISAAIPEETPPDVSVSENVCVFSIECSAVLNAPELIDGDILELLPEDGVVFAAEEEFSDGETVFDVLKRVCRENGIHMEYSMTPLYGSAYIEGIANLYEFDCGAGSGWVYTVNGVSPNFGCSSCELKPGDVVEWRYSKGFDE